MVSETGETERIHPSPVGNGGFIDTPATSEEIERIHEEHLNEYYNQHRWLLPKDQQVEPDHLTRFLDVLAEVYGVHGDVGEDLPDIPFSALRIARHGQELERVQSLIRLSTGPESETQSSIRPIATATIRSIMWYLLTGSPDCLEEQPANPALSDGKKESYVSFTLEGIKHLNTTGNIETTAKVLEKLQQELICSCAALGITVDLTQEIVRTIWKGVTVKSRADPESLPGRIRTVGKMVIANIHESIDENQTIPDTLKQKIKDRLHLSWGYATRQDAEDTPYQLMHTSVILGQLQEVKRLLAQKKEEETERGEKTAENPLARSLIAVESAQKADDLIVASYDCAAEIRKHLISEFGKNGLTQYVRTIGKNGDGPDGKQVLSETFLNLLRKKTREECVTIIGKLLPAENTSPETIREWYALGKIYTQTITGFVTTKFFTLDELAEESRKVQRIRTLRARMESIIRSESIKRNDADNLTDVMAVLRYDQRFVDREGKCPFLDPRAFHYDVSMKEGTKHLISIDLMNVGVRLQREAMETELQVADEIAQMKENGTPTGEIAGEIVEKTQRLSEETYRLLEKKLIMIAQFIEARGGYFSQKEIACCVPGGDEMLIAIPDKTGEGGMTTEEVRELCFSLRREMNAMEEGKDGSVPVRIALATIDVPKLAMPSQQVLGESPPPVSDSALSSIQKEERKGFQEILSRIQAYLSAVSCVQVGGIDLAKILEEVVEPEDRDGLIVHVRKEDHTSRYEIFQKGQKDPVRVSSPDSTVIEKIYDLIRRQFPQTSS